MKRYKRSLRKPENFKTLKQVSYILKEIIKFLKFGRLCAIMNDIKG